MGYNKLYYLLCIHIHYNCFILFLFNFFFLFFLNYTFQSIVSLCLCLFFYKSLYIDLDLVHVKPGFEVESSMKAGLQWLVQLW